VPIPFPFARLEARLAAATIFHRQSKRIENLAFFEFNRDHIADNNITQRPNRCDGSDLQNAMTMSATPSSRPARESTVHGSSASREDPFALIGEAGSDRDVTALGFNHARIEDRLVSMREGRSNRTTDISARMPLPRLRGAGRHDPPRMPRRSRAQDANALEKRGRRRDFGLEYALDSVADYWGRASWQSSRARCSPRQRTGGARGSALR